MPRRNRPEEQVQRAIVEWLRWIEPDCKWLHIPNGGARTKAEAGILKALGVEAGAPDLHLCLNGGWCAYIEIKKPGGRVTPEQTAFRNKCERRGARWALAESIEDVERIFHQWGVKCQRQISR